MPVHPGHDEYGFFYQWGHHGKHYYFNPADDISRLDALERAQRQGRAVYARGWHHR